ncbi:PREDICTED: mitochondrial amidoxime reducing component 2-like isoform X2 [Branchiostoma belcheri]|uniref:Mitochondrial amidoxime reducing component 2-like isoform X1 n=1 Tax=Branchiostoma belcheri TaxID=7741 RepID=A0A6P4YXI2_BRABE|nr:PREDICTED: mitochondrial amidoxime reducing component 2-like isoform X1 [Branchiostoma belcheri]XP_019621967.1 PREDICTED: mitochondrial amidoxime reducing component 2-like isoform X2 [Branchiostoma belcheri]
MDGLKVALESRQLVVLTLSTTAVIAAGLAYLKWRRPRTVNRQYVPVGHVSKIYVHPVKSCRGLEVGEAEVTKLGLRLEGVMDRHLLILYKDRFLDGRTEPRVVLISPQCAGDGQVRLEAPGMDPLTLPKPNKQKVYDISMFELDGDGVDCGPEAAAWLEQFLGKPGYRLVMSAPGSKKRHTDQHPKYKDIAKPDDKVGFQHETALMLASEASLSDLNNKLDTPVAMRNFRPNIVVSGCEPFQEDNWQYVRIGEVEIRRMLPCNRCLMTTVDPETGMKNGTQEPLKTLRSYRLTKDEKYKAVFGQSPLFGLTCGVEQEGVIHIGDTVYVCT